MPANYRPRLVETLTRWAYAVLLMLMIPFAFIKLVIRSRTRSNGYKHKRLERFGFVARPAKTGGLLIHCVSVGEVMAASKLVRRLLQADPDMMIALTTTTPTGSDRVRQMFADKVQHFYLPYDLPLCMASMLRRVQPCKVLITEVELWPNLIHACWLRKIPVYVINARMTDRSMRNYRKVPLLFNPMLAKVHKVCAQGQRDYDNYLALGIDKRKLHLTNNIKFDLLASQRSAVHEALAERLKLTGKRVLLAGSTHNPEEQKLIEAYRMLRRDINDLVLLLVPRHPQRFDKIWQLCQESGLTATRSSRATPDHSSIVLIDEMGVLTDLYALAEVAFVGGSLADKGGHNALEAAAFSVPMLMGPHTYNNPEICKVLEQAGALKIVHTEDELIGHFRDWLLDPERARQSGMKGQQVLQQNAGALDKTLSLLND